MNVQNATNDISHDLADLGHIRLRVFSTRLVCVIPLLTYPVMQLEVTQFHINVIPRLREAATLKNSNDIFMFIEQTE